MGRMIDVIEDLWEIFECPECRILYFSDETVREHLVKVHNMDGYYGKIFSVEFIRAIPQNNGVKKDGQ